MVLHILTSRRSGELLALRKHSVIESVFMTVCDQPILDIIFGFPLSFIFRAVFNSSSSFQFVLIGKAIPFNSVYSLNTFHFTIKVITWQCTFFIELACNNRLR